MLPPLAQTAFFPDCFDARVAYWPASYPYLPASYPKVSKLYVLFFPVFARVSPGLGLW